MFCLAGLTLMACSNVSKQISGEELLDMLNERQVSLLVYNNDSISEYNQYGVLDLLFLVENEPGRLCGALVADKVVGKASASLMVLGKVGEVHTNCICTPAKEMLQEAGIAVSYKEEVPFIINKKKTGQCPLDSTLNDIESAGECLPAIVNFYSR